MNKESLCNLPSLVNLMDENLAINIADFINNEILRDLQLNQNQLIQTIKSSNKFHFDNKTGLIKFKEKADRNILIISNFVNEDERKEKEEFVKDIIGEFCAKYVKEIKKIDHVGNAFHVVFQNEDISMDVEKYFISLLENENSSKENSKFFGDLRGANICLAAESLKRRVLTHLVIQPLWKQVQIVNKMIGSYLQRRYTAAAEKIYQMPVNKNSFNNNQNSNSKVPSNNQRLSFISPQSENNYPQMIPNNTPSKQPLNSKMLHNKFDFIEEHVAFVRQMSKDIVARKHSYFKGDSNFNIPFDDGEKSVLPLPLPLKTENDLEIEKILPPKTENFKIRKFIF